MWKISAEQLFNTVNGELVFCLGKKNRASAQPASLRCLPLGSKPFQGIATMTYTRSHTRPSQKDLGCVVYPLNNKSLEGTILVYCCPSIFSLTSPRPSPPPKLNVQYIQTVCVWGGEEGGDELCCRPYSARILHSVSDQIQNLPYCFTTPKQNDQWRRH